VSSWYGRGEGGWGGVAHPSGTSHGKQSNAAAAASAARQSAAACAHLAPMARARWRVTVVSQADQSSPVR
jgi:hypothetical protein